jgi:hypothetical protein
LDKVIEAQSIKYCQKHEKISISIFNSVATSRWRGGFAGRNHPDFDYHRCGSFCFVSGTDTFLLTNANK